MPRAVLRGRRFRSARALLAGAIAAAALWQFAGHSVFAAGQNDTVVTGEQMEIVGNGRKIIFSGGAKVVHGQSVLIADRLVQDRDRNRVDAYGGLTFEAVTKDGEPLKGRAGRGKYYPVKEQGELWENRPEVVFQAKDSTGPVTMVADRIRFDQKKEEIYAEGLAQVMTSSACAYSPSLLFRQKDQTAVLDRTPAERGKPSAASGVRTPPPAPGQDLEGVLQRARPEVIYRSEESTGPVHVIADRIVLDQKREEGNASGRVEVISSSACAYSPAAVFRQKEKKIELQADGTTQPEIVYLKDGEQSRYRADLITFFTDTRKTFLRGNVRAVMPAKELEKEEKGSSGKR